METSELIKKVRKIEIKTKGLSSHIFSGEYHSAFKGRGMSFSEVREYQYGDEIRTIDWNVTARTGRPHVKIFEEERELTVMLLIDVSCSTDFGSGVQTKRDIQTEIAAVLAFSAINNNDKVGVLFFSDRVEKFIPPKKGRQHILRIIRELIDLQPSRQGTDLSQALQYFNSVMKKRTICFVLSDFQCEGYEPALRIIGKRHDVVGIHLYDRLEVNLPSVGMLRVRDAETGQLLWMDSGSAAVRKAFTARFSALADYAKITFLRCGADRVVIQANESYVNALLKFFQKRIGT